MPFYPGPGLGGHCVPIDPFYLAWRAQEFGIAPRFITLARHVNRTMPENVVGELAKALAGRTSAAWNLEALGAYDAVLIVTDHDAVDYCVLAETAHLIVDTRNACGRAGANMPRGGEGVNEAVDAGDPAWRQMND